MVCSDVETDNNTNEIDLNLYVNSEYISAGCNPVTCALDWGKENVIAYAVCNSVALYLPYIDKGDVNSSVIFSTLHGHTSKVTVVTWVKNTNVGDSFELISGSANGEIIIWSRNEAFTYKQTGLLKAFDSVIQVIDAVVVDSSYANLIIAASSCGSSAIKIWKRVQQEIILTDTLKLPADLCLSLKFTTIPNLGSTILFGCATNNHYIHFYSSDYSDFVKDESLFELQLSLKTTHSDWIRSLDFVPDKGNDSVLLATGSQDMCIRMWRLVPVQCTNTSEENTLVVTNAGEKFIYCVKLTTVLQGHEGWIYSVQFPSDECDKLLSVSMDKTLIIWKLDKTSDLWVEDIRFGKVGSDSLGYLGGSFDPTCTRLVAYDFHGGLHMWIWKSQLKQWISDIVCGGHCSPVTDVQWDPNGNYVVSAGKDKTVRVHAPWKKYSDCVGRTLWFEFARPQLHGYDMSCLAVLPDCRFVSGSEEKIVRSFIAPKKFVENCKNYSYLDNVNDDSFRHYTVNLQPLNLSAEIEPLSGDDKVVSKQIEEYSACRYGIPVSCDLAERTLWPEVCKMYSHPNEIVALAATSDGCLVASSCHGTTQQECAIVIWETRKWKELQKLYCHSLNVTQLSFSPDNKYLLSVSRDRCWSIFQKKENLEFEKTDGTVDVDSIHRRIIFCSSWTHDSKYFATGSREGKLVIWGSRESLVKNHVNVFSVDGDVCISIQPDVTLQKDINNRQSKEGDIYVPVSVFLFKKQSVTSVSFAPGFIYGRPEYFFVVGFENGLIRYIFWNTDYSTDWTSRIIGKFYTHHQLSVERLVFRPSFGKPGFPSERNDTLLLASCGKDHIIYIHKLSFLDKLIDDKNNMFW